MALPNWNAKLSVGVRSNYAELKQHQSLHRELTLRLQGFLASTDRGEAAINVESLYALRHRLTNHILRVDGGYRSWFAEHGVRLGVEAAQTYI
jgi:hemerythrin